MVELDQFRYRISGYDKPMAQIKKSLDLDNKQKRIEELEADMETIAPICQAAEEFAPEYDEEKIFEKVKNA